MSKHLDFFWHTLLCTIPCAAELSVLIGVPVLGCLWPNSSSVVRMGTPSLALIKMPPYSASAAEDRTIFMILQKDIYWSIEGRITVLWDFGGLRREVEETADAAAGIAN